MTRFAALHVLLFCWHFHGGQASIGWSKFDLKEGQEQYSAVMDQTKHPTYGGCWLQAVEHLRSDCYRLTADIQRRMAFTFANCFLETSGLSTYSCSKAEQDLNSCIKRMKERDFSVYTAFFTHTANMCFFLSSQLWNRETEGTINRLVDASAIVSSGMETTLRLQQEWMESDKEHHKAMSLAMESSRLTALDLFQQIVRIRESIFGELASLYTVVFYFFSLTFSFLLTSSRRTESARFWLFCLFMSALALEYLAIDRNPEDGLGGNLEETKDSLYITTWFIRKASICVAVMVLSVSVYTYCDLNHLIKDTNEQVHALNKYLIQAKMLAAANCNGINGVQSYNGKALAPSVPTAASVIVPRRENPPCFLSSDEETFSGGESERSMNRSYNERDELPVKRSSRTYTRQKKDYRANAVSPNCRYNLRNRNQLSPPAINVMLYESPEMFSAVVHRLETSTRRQSEALRHSLMESSLRGQGYEQQAAAKVYTQDGFRR